MNNLSHETKVKLPNTNVEADIEYKMSKDGTYAIASNCLNKEKATTATIQSTYNDVLVTTIDACAFKDCSSLTSIDIPGLVTHIDTDALNCPNLKKIITTLDTTLDFHPGDYGVPSTASIWMINVRK